MYDLPQYGLAFSILVKGARMLRFIKRTENWRLKGLWGCIAIEVLANAAKQLVCLGVDVRHGSSGEQGRKVVENVLSVHQLWLKLQEQPPFPVFCRGKVGYRI